MKYFNKFLALFFILSGLNFTIGIPELIFNRFQQGEILLGITSIIFLCIYILSIFAGVQLWRNKEIGKSICWYLLLFQSVTFDLSAISYRFTSLFDFFIYYRVGESLGYDGYFGGRFALSFPDTPANIMIGVNIVAIVFLIILSKEYLPQKIVKFSSWINEEPAKTETT